MNRVRSLVTQTAVVGAMAAAGLALSTGSAAADTGGSVNWDSIAQCESGGNWSANTGNGFYGGLQISQATWAAHGGAGSPATASREQQIRVADRILANQGPQAWPTCANHRAGPSARWSAPARTPGSYLVNSVTEIIGLFSPGR
ncbi:transglycosylase family protein [Mycolicibacillus parakoreensis]|uniref:Transglycosylase family protein n=2 Tax=Mycolicibacillus parakoreensis TaxID=1069221 RepID=A0ABY3U423_9MYCO|nr:transglycosylase family protein [Mycolicibacillus parakoreensis]MCV7317511.1 transglycosylase family protein [Mycolicibacillus parakoreensis]ULN54228.1 transglycosylase family protein [Mycolicibacillus parakoreensis]